MAKAIAFGSVERWSAIREKRPACFDRLSMRFFLHAMKILRLPHPELVEGGGRTESMQRMQLRLPR